MKDKNKTIIMENKYYTNRHYRNTDKIRIAVNKMNKDMRELSEYCDKLEAEIERLNNIINEFEIWLLKHSKIDYGCAESIVHEQLALGIAFNYLQELKGSDKE